jgi:16S rRNA (guanine527-N7)-methyltransferase
VTNTELETLTTKAIDLGVHLIPERSAGLIRYLEILDETNRSFNLTRIPREDYVTLHLLDSLATLRGLPETFEPKRILDIGTGAGFPGVPLAAALPNSKVTLLDSTLKKVRFAAETATTCGITNCVQLHARAEALASETAHRGRYDLVVSRAVAAFGTLIQLMLPLVAPGGFAVALKGAKVKEELEGTASTIRKLRGSEPEVIPVTLPGSDVERYLIVIRRLAAR